jgi:hypothetical protein
MATGDMPSARCRTDLIPRPSWTARGSQRER